MEFIPDLTKAPTLENFEQAKNWLLHGPDDMFTKQIWWARWEKKMMRLAKEHQALAGQHYSI